MAPAPIGVRRSLSPYGALLGLKLAAVAMLAGGRLVAPPSHHHRPRQAASEHAFRRLVGAELVVLLSAAGLGVALSRTAPPAPPASLRGPSPRLSPCWAAACPRLSTPSQWITAWNDRHALPAPRSRGHRRIPVGCRGVCGRRGDTWSWLRTASWLAGCLLFLWATNGAPGTYGRVLFSMHMVQHMTIATGGSGLPGPGHTDHPRPAGAAAPRRRLDEVRASGC